MRLVGSGGAFAGLYFFEEPDDADAEEAEEREPAEDVDEGPVGSLTSELLVERGLGGAQSVGVTEPAGEKLSRGLHRVLKLLASDGDGVDDLVLVDGTAAGEECLSDGDADAATHVAHQVEEAAGVADLLVVERTVGCSANGDEDEAEAEAGDEDGEEKSGGREVQGDIAEVKRGEAEGEEAEGEEDARIYFVR